MSIQQPVSRPAASAADADDALQVPATAVTPPVRTVADEPAPEPAAAPAPARPDEQPMPGKGPIGQRNGRPSPWAPGGEGQALGPPARYVDPPTEPGLRIGPPVGVPRRPMPCQWEEQFEGSAPPPWPGFPPPLTAGSLYPGEGAVPVEVDELTDATLVRPTRAAPTQGWRAAVYALTGGAVNPGLSPQEAARGELVRRVRRPMTAGHRIAVVSVKGGVGKTTVAACLGLVFAELRGDRVIALDANPDAGTLSERLTGPGGLTVRDLYEDIPNLASVGELTRYTRAAGRLHVLGSEQEPALGEAFTAGEYLEVCALLARFYNILITDSGTGMVHSAMEATLATADSLVVVGSPTVDGANRASKTLGFLVTGPYRALAEQALVVLCGDRHSPDVDRARIRMHFASRCRAVIDIPPDPHLATGGRIDFTACQESTKDAFYLTAAYLADAFGPVHAADRQLRQEHQGPAPNE